jgi:hypothetical protein
MSANRRHHIFTENSTAHNIAPCCICGEPIHRLNDQWIIEHVRALALLGKDTNTNCGPAHASCASEKTHKQDLPRIRKAKRQQAMHEATRKPSRGFMVPPGFVYDWKLRRYVRAPLPSSS